MLEKHGPHAPIGSDLIHVREWAARATKTEYAVVFPDYFYGQIYEARHQPGTFALPSRLVWDLLEATCDEMARNGFKKILIINGHGGNPNFLRYFVQAQLERRRDYVVYFHDPAPDPAFNEQVTKMRKSDPGRRRARRRARDVDAALPAARPGQAGSRGERVGRQPEASDPARPLHRHLVVRRRIPNHYAGDGAVATRELGQLITEHRIASIVKALRTIKADTTAPALQQRVLRSGGEGIEARLESDAQLADHLPAASRRRRRAAGSPRRTGW